MAIARFVATANGMIGKNDEEAAIIDSIVDTCTDLTDLLVTANFEPDEEKKVCCCTYMYMYLLKFGKLGIHISSTTI